MATRYNITSTVQRVVSGNLTPGSSASALITDPNGTALTTYAAETGAGQVTNPIATSALGRIEAWVATPDYNIQVSGTGITTYTEYIRQSPQGTVAVIGSSALNWGTGFGVSDTNLYRAAADVLQTDDQFSIQRALVGDTAFRVRLSGEANNRFYMDGAGTQNWGAGGASAPDTSIWRYGPAIMASSGSLYLPNGYIQTGSAAGAAAYFGGITYFGPTGTAGPWDVNLYRTSANILRTDDHFQAGNFTADNQVFVGSNGKEAIHVTPTTGTPGITFGGDTNLYRATANILKTDDWFEISGNVGFYGRAATAINATPFTNGAAVSTSQYDLPSGFTVNQLAAFVMTALRQLGDVNGVGLLNTTGV